MCNICQTETTDGKYCVLIIEHVINVIIEHVINVNIYSHPLFSCNYSIKFAEIEVTTGGKGSTSQSAV